MTKHVPLIPAEGAEVAWARSELGKAAHNAAWLKLRELDLVQYVDATQLGQIIYAALVAAWPATEPMEDVPAPAHDHQWAILGAQPHTPAVMLGKPVPHTIVLIRCTECGEPDTRMLPGEWTLAQLQQTASGLGLVAVENGSEDLSAKLTTTGDDSGG